MIITLDEMKNYLRVDYAEDDALIESLISSSERLCMDVARIDDVEAFEGKENAKIAVMYAVAYQYEHREDADHHALLLTLRALLFGIREGEYF
ncbi:MAG: phage gp6-like head-tail connector protein [Lachnospiraceae bacterium]|nr:phage gp6-like head-tail connector protein [Lachnospiraceae bacterium]